LRYLYIGISSNPFYVRLSYLVTPSMFAYLIWENKDGKEMKAMFQIEKAIKMVDMMKERGVDPKFIISLG